jgi:predicted O-linked N-acetylglucosamine transferase (SPINDLY family)
MGDQLKFIQKISIERDAQILYMPSVGMFPLTMFLCNLRVAPLQAMALGHPATSHSDVMDFVVVEEDYIGDPKCFSEQLMKLPKDGMPYRKSELIDRIQPLYLKKEKGATVDIVVCATVMKINPEFLRVCAAIANEAKKEVRFHFLVGQAIGLLYVSVKRFIHNYLGGKAIVYQHQPYPDYIDVIAKCDLFLNPFPFGNTNGIIDTVSAGLVGVCKTGDEVFEHIDQGLFERLNFPSWMIAKTNEEYIKAAVRLIDNSQERIALRKKLTGEQAIQLIFNGRPEIMGGMLKDALIARSNECL